MRIEEATIWVDQNRGMLAKQAMAYTGFAPYAVNDYLQDAYEAAIKAAVCCQRNPKLVFEQCFMTIWRRIIASVTPFPDDAREAFKEKKAAEKALREGKVSQPLGKELDDDAENGELQKKKAYHSGGTSMSFPLNARRSGVKLEMIQAKGSKKCKLDIEAIYKERVKPLLSEKEAQVMEYSLGIAREGQLSEREIAAKMGVTRDTVREYFDRGLKKAKKGNVINLSRRDKGNHQFDTKKTTASSNEADPLPHAANAKFGR